MTQEGLAYLAEPAAGLPGQRVVEQQDHAGAGVPVPLGVLVELQQPRLVAVGVDDGVEA